MEGQLLWKFTLTYSNLQITVIHCSQLQERQYITSKDKKVYHYFDLVGNVQHITIKRKEPITRKYFCDSYIFPVTYQHPVCQRLFLCPRSEAADIEASRHARAILLLVPILSAPFADYLNACSKRLSHPHVGWKLYSFLGDCLFIFNLRTKEVNKT